MPEPVAPTTAIVEGMCSEQLQNSSRFKESILFWATKLRVASRALETVLQVSNILYPRVMLGRRAGLLFISSMANIIACSQRNPRKLYLEERNGRKQEAFWSTSLEYRLGKAGLNLVPLLWFHDVVFFETQSPLCKMGITPTSEGGCEHEIIMHNSQHGASHRVRD